MFQRTPFSIWESKIVSFSAEDSIRFYDLSQNRMTKLLCINLDLTYKPLIEYSFGRILVLGYSIEADYSSKFGSKLLTPSIFKKFEIQRSVHVKTGLQKKGNALLYLLNPTAFREIMIVDSAKEKIISKKKFDRSIYFDEVCYSYNKVYFVGTTNNNQSSYGIYSINPYNKVVKPKYEGHFKHIAVFHDEILYFCMYSPREALVVVRGKKDRKEYFYF